MGGFLLPDMVMDIDRGCALILFFGVMESHTFTVL